MYTVEKKTINRKKVIIYKLIKMYDIKKKSYL